MNSFERRFLSALNISASMWPENGAFSFQPEDDPCMKVLVVVAHPDDESECAATLYRVTHELGGVVDEVIVTNGEAGHQYSAPARAYYGLQANGRDWRRKLVRIRREELVRAGRILGVRHHYFLDQIDTGRTLSAREGFESWEIAAIRQQLFELLKYNNYDLVLTLLPLPDTHGHHKTVAVLTFDAIEKLPLEQRPAALGVRTFATGEEPIGEFRGLAEYPVTRTAHSEPVWCFDRSTPMNCHCDLSYSMVVNWAIAEHKSQGMFQMESTGRTHECFWLFEAGGETGALKSESFMRRMYSNDPNERIGPALPLSAGEPDPATSKSTIESHNG
jgi:LmbE family N-acetylglucosaminyl deacetylase